MSTFAVEVVKIDDIQPHPNADRLEIATMKGWQCVVGKGSFHPGDLCVYIPIDAVLPEDVMNTLFEGAKIKPSSRVKTIKLRGAISQGIAAQLVALGVGDAELGDDVGEYLGITKYEPPAASFQAGAAKAGPKQVNPNFRKYTSIENAKNYKDKVFEEGELVIVTEKIHGTNFRAGYVPFYADTLWKKVKKFLHLAPKYEFVYGSHNVQLKGGGNVYADIVEKYRLRENLAEGEVVYGEIFGDGIQKGYNYGLTNGERQLVLFDIMVDGEYLSPVAFKVRADQWLRPTVPVLYKGPFNFDKIKSLTAGPSVLAPAQKVREGVVCKPVEESSTFIGRKVLKFISDEYLLRDQTDFH
jgi:RNA ligase (TIGR02306 family)